MTCEDRGPDLLAHALGQLDPAESRDLEAHLAGCTACRDETVRLRADADRAAGAPATAPPADGLARLLAAVEDEAGDRRAAAAVARAASCERLRDDVVAAAVGGSAARSPAFVAHLAACPPCSDEHDVAERLVAAQRAAPRAVVPPAGLRRLLAAVDGATPRPNVAVPSPPPAGRRVRRPRWTAFLVPLAAAAAVLVAVALTPGDRLCVEIRCDTGALLGQGAPGSPARWVDRAAGAFDLASGAAVASGESPVDLALAFGRAPSGDSEPGAGEVRLTLAPRSRLLRRTAAEFELEAGSVTVRAGVLEAPLTIRHGALFCRVVGTRFDAAVLDGRLVVDVAEGRVEIGRTGGDGAGSAAGPAAPGASRVLGAGRQGLVDAERILERAADGRPATDAFLAPRVTLTAAATSLVSGRPLDLTAELACGPGGTVAVAPFDASEPRFLVRLKGPDGREREVKVQPSASSGTPAGPLPVRLADGEPCRLGIRLPGSELGPGTWELRIRYQSYRPRPDGAEWHGSVESEPIRIQVEPE